MRDHRTLTQDDLLAECSDRFGDDPMDWAFECPHCGDVATGRDFRQALAEHPRTRKDDSKVVASDVLGRQCIGRVLGALSAGDNESWTASGGRGCDWTAYGLFSGPWTVTTPDGPIPCFPIAQVPA